MKSFKRLLGGGVALALLFVVLVPLRVSAAPALHTGCAFGGHYVCTEHQQINDRDSTYLCGATCSGCGHHTFIPEPALHGGGGGHTHSYGNWTVTQTPTCANTGTKKRTCSCGSFETQTLPKDSNNHTSWSTIAVANCTTKEQQRCNGCGATREVGSVDSSNHAYGGSWVQNKASCTSNGNYAKTCSRCGNVTGAGTIYSHGGHVSLDASTKTYENSGGITNGTKKYWCNRGATSTHSACSTLLHTEYWGSLQTRYELQPGIFTEYVTAISGDYRSYGAVMSPSTPLSAAAYAYAVEHYDIGTVYTGGVSIGQAAMGREYKVTYYRKRTYIDYGKGVAP